MSPGAALFHTDGYFGMGWGWITDWIQNQICQKLMTFWNKYFFQLFNKSMGQWKTAVTPLLTHLAKMNLSCMINIFVDNLATQDARVSAAMIMTKLAWYIWAYRTGQVNPSNIIHKIKKKFWSHCLMLLYAIQDPMCPPGKCTRILRLIIQNICFIILWFYFNVNPLALAPPKFHGLSCFYVFHGLWYYMNCKTIFQHIEWFFFKWNHWQMAILSSKIYDVIYSLF